MKIHDISMEISREMQVYKNQEIKRPVFKTDSDYIKGHHYESSISLSLHTGTHIDAPLHMIENGGFIDSYALETFITKCKVVDMTHVTDGISYDDLKDKNIKPGDFILFKTRNSFEDNFNADFIYLKDDGAKYLAELPIKGVGTDGLGIERAQPNHETHKYLLRKNIPIMEGVRLKDVNEGEYQLIALPIKIKGVEASFTRAVLIEN